MKYYAFFPCRCRCLPSPDRFPAAAVFLSAKKSSRHEIIIAFSPCRWYNTLITNVENAITEKRESRMNRLLLASKSPRRAELLRGIGVKFDICPSDADESLVKGSDPAETVRLLALLKASSVAKQDRGAHVLTVGSDTLVEAPNEEVLGKPKDDEDAARMLRLLSGKEHFVHTGIALVDKDGRSVSATETTTVRFLPLTERDIQTYISTGEPRDKAGAYGIQERGGLFVTGIEGDYFSVMGLPLCRLDRLMRESFFCSLLDFS